MFKGITKRWMLNTLSVIFTIIVLIVVSLIFVIHMFTKAVLNKHFLRQAMNCRLYFQTTRATTQQVLIHLPVNMLKTLTVKSKWKLL